MTRTPGGGYPAPTSASRRRQHPARGAGQADRRSGRADATEQDRRAQRSRWSCRPVRRSRRAGADPATTFVTAGSWIKDLVMSGRQPVPAAQRVHRDCAWISAIWRGGHAEGPRRQRSEDRPAAPCVPGAATAGTPVPSRTLRVAAAACEHGVTSGATLRNQRTDAANRYCSRHQDCARSTSAAIVCGKSALICGPICGPSVSAAGPVISIR